MRGGGRGLLVLLCPLLALLLSAIRLQICDVNVWALDAVQDRQADRVVDRLCLIQVHIKNIYTNEYIYTLSTCSTHLLIYVDVVCVCLYVWIYV